MAINGAFFNLSNLLRLARHFSYQKAMSRQSIEDFNIYWTKKNQSFVTTGKKRRNLAPHSIDRLSNWTDVDHHGDQGSKFRHIFYTQLDFQDHNEWHFERALGKGAFGAVVLFCKRDDDQKAVDVSPHSCSEVSWDWG